MLWRALLTWVLLVVVAVLNGAIRSALLIPRFGERAAHVVSTLSLCVFILLVAWIFIPWMHPHGVQGALWIGSLWLLLTIAFEFLAGRYLFGRSWEALLADYNVARGRVWVLVLITTFLAPLLAVHARHL